MKLKDIPGVMLGKKVIEGMNLNKAQNKHYNQALTEQSEVEVEMDKKEATKIIASSSLYNCGTGSHNALSELVKTISDNLPSILKVKR